MGIDEEAVLNLCFVMIRLYQKKESRSLLEYPWLRNSSEINPDAMIAMREVLSFAPLALVRACMLTQYWRARGLLLKSDA